MVKKFTVYCDDVTGGTMPIDLYVGNPEGNHHPLHFQNVWLGKERNIKIPQEVMDSMKKLKEVSDRNHVPFEELFHYSMNAVYQITDQ